MVSRCMISFWSNSPLSVRVAASETPASPGTTRLSAPSTIGISSNIASSNRSANTIVRLRRTSVTS